MKRLITALSLSAVAFSASALETGKPFEQLDVDRALPNVEFAQVEGYVATSRAPFDQLVIGRTLPNVSERKSLYASVGGTRSDAGADVSTESVWANDYNFIAPAQ